MATYKLDASSNPSGFFSFPQDQAARTADGEDEISFITGFEAGEADEEGPEEVYDRLVELLSPTFPDIEVGAAESVHIVRDVAPNDHGKTITTIRQILTSHGWVESEMA